MQAPHGVGRIEVDLDVQAVVAKQHALQRVSGRPVAGESRGVRESGAGAVRELHLESGRRSGPESERDDIAEGAVRERHRVVEDPGSALDDPLRAGRVEVWSAFRAVRVGHRVGAVERVVEASPARVGRVQRVAGRAQRHHELRSGDARDLGIHVPGRDLESPGPPVRQVADAGEELPHFDQVDLAAAVLAVPFVDFPLQGVAPFEQLAVFRPQFGHDGGERGPESLGIDSGAGRRLVTHEIVQRFRYCEATDRDACFHPFSLHATSAEDPSGGPARSSIPACARLSDRRRRRLQHAPPGAPPR